MYGGVDVVVEVVGAQGPNVKWGQRYLPVKPKTECVALGISLILKLSVGVGVGICRVG